jgi:hypothetical protein
MSENISDRNSEILLSEDNSNRTNTPICILHTSSFFIEGNINNISILQELIYSFNAVYNLGLKFIFSLNNSTTNLIVNDLPVIIFGNHVINKGNIFSFLKQFVKIRDKYSFKSLDSLNTDELYLKKIQIENLEKIILTDLQLILNYYSSYINSEKTNFFWKFIKFLLQPIKSVKTNKNDKSLNLEITKMIGVSTKFEAIEMAFEINRRINSLLEEFDDEYFNSKRLRDRKFNSLDLLIYSSYKAQKRSFKNKFNDDEFKEKFKKMDLLIKEIDNFILNKELPKQHEDLLLSEEYISPKM